MFAVDITFILDNRKTESVSKKVVTVFLAFENCGRRNKTKLRLISSSQVLPKTQDLFAVCFNHWLLQFNELSIRTFSQSFCWQWQVFTESDKKEKSTRERIFSKKILEWKFFCSKKWIWKNGKYTLAWRIVLFIMN